MSDISGTVKVSIVGEFMVQRYEEDREPSFYEAPLACPVCESDIGLTLVARRRDSSVECPNGHTWQDPSIAAAKVRRLVFLSWTGQAVADPSSVAYTNTVPALDEDAARADLPAGWTEPGEDDVYRNVEIGSSVYFDHGLLTMALMYARRLAMMSLPVDGGLWQRLQPQMGGSAIDAHMAIVLTALAMYEVSVRSGNHDVGEAALAQVEAMLRPENAAGLRALFPVAYPPKQFVPELRAADVQRLAHADSDTFERWRRAAADITTIALDTTVERTAAYAGRLGQRGLLVAKDPYRQQHDDDLTWYLN
ncbi:hypothetical protein [Streptacidiphilus sp. MAP5-52]|uniref:hypothetical protein n=1 Tax=Streptacidiphilus sp. MAP5-52 TaxID=3156267 RepID=UPI003517CA13